MKSDLLSQYRIIEIPMRQPTDDVLAYQVSILATFDISQYAAANSYFDNIFSLLSDIQSVIILVKDHHDKSYFVKVKAI